MRLPFARLPFACVALFVAVAAAAPAPPVAERGATVDTIQGVSVADPYRWLEAGADPKVKAWVAGQNAASRAALDAIPARAPLAAYLRRIETGTATYDAGIRQAGGRLFGLTYSPARQQPVLVALVLSGAAVTRRTILDPNALSATGGTAIDWFEPSPDGRLVAVSLSRGGSEDGTLHVYDVATGREIEAPIARVQYPTAGGSLAWTADSRGFWYTRYPGDEAPEADRHVFQQVYLHRIGADAARDRLVLATGDGVPRTGEIFLGNRAGGPNALASVQLGDGGEWRHFLLTPDGGQRLVARYEDRIVAATLGPDGALYGLSRRDAPNGRIVRLADPRTQTADAARVIVPEGPVAFDSSENDSALTVTGTGTGGRLFATAIDGGPMLVKGYTLAGKPIAIPSPPLSTVGGIEPTGDGGIWFRRRGYLAPSALVRWNPKTGAVAPTPIRIVSPLSFTDIAATRVFAVSKDGTRIPVTILARRGTKPDGANPALLYGYGGFGISMTPHFLGAFERAWFDAGGIYAIANIRGGGEYGERWHREGMLTAKQNDFDDFYAAARLLVDRRWTNPEKLALMGGSNGGLLMGAVITQHPALARAVVSEVGIYDMIRLELDPNGSFNVSEYGSVKDPAQFHALHAYSPLHHVTAGAPYPALLLTTGDNDGRVNPAHSRKFAAAMQAATGSGRPVYLRTSANAGHGMGSSLDERIALSADTEAFLMDQLGMTWAPPQAPPPSPRQSR